MCVLLASITKLSRGETNPEIKKISKHKEDYGRTKEPDHQSSIEMSKSVAYSTVEQQP